MYYNYSTLNSNLKLYIWVVARITTSFRLYPNKLSMMQDITNADHQEFCAEMLDGIGNEDVLLS